MRSLYSKIVLVSMLILIVGSLLLNMGLNYLYKSYMVNQTYKEMRELTDTFVENITPFFKNGKIDKEGVKSEMESFEQYGNVMPILITNNKTSIISTSSVQKADLILSSIEKSEINKVINTNKPIYREAGLKIGENTKQYTLIYPLKKLVNTDVILLLNKSVPNISRTSVAGTKFSFLAIIAVSIYAYITIIVLTGSLTKEIQTLNNSVIDITKGNYNTSLKVSRNDEIGELSRNLMVMSQSLKDVEDSRRKFISNISHDMRSPMTSIKGYINGIIDGTVPQDKQEVYLKRVADESERMIKMINDILDLSKVQDANLELNISEVDINSLIINILDKFEGKINSKNIDMEINFNTSHFAECDKKLLHRVLNNLIDNAIKFVNQAGTIEINTDKRGEKFIVGIKNTGAYINQDDIKQIWSRFYKVDKSRGMEKNSSGLGLSIVKEIIDLHGEKIDVYSDNDDGTLFIFTLKLAPQNKKRKLT